MAKIDDEIPALLEQVRRAWLETQVVSPQAQWTPMIGGRSNPVWHVSDAQSDFVCKLYDSTAVSQLFANDADREWAALTAFSPVKLAPKPISRLLTVAGPTLLYEYVDGDTWRPEGETHAVGRALAQLHGFAPLPELPQCSASPERLITQTRNLLADIGRNSEAPIIASTLPAAKIVPLHGDPVAGNMIETTNGLCFIDWQSPMNGDSCDDIAIFLSPAMLMLYGAHPLKYAEISAFWQGYNCRQSQARYEVLAPLYHWRMWAYCLWQGARGNADYAAAANVEWDAMKSALTAASKSIRP